MDFGAYGGEAATPTIDRLAGQGVMFTNYHTSPLCAPSRAMLLTGLDNHRAGVATIPEVLPPEQRGRPGYLMHLAPGVQTIAARLKAAGYRTYMTGKWHLSEDGKDLPNRYGFDRSFALEVSGADNWEQKSFMPYYDEAPWYEDGKPARLPDDFYSSRFLVDRMIEYLRSDEGDPRPFFAYLAFQAIHIPVQAPPEFTAKYEDVYTAGWQALRESRWRRAQTRRLIPLGAPLGAMPPGLRAWESLAPEDRRIYAKSMAVNAGMLEAMDFHLGRLVAYLQESGLIGNTLFAITSDNGPAPSNPYPEPLFRLWMRRHGYSRELATLGEKGSFCFIGPEWASAAASPGAFFKFYVGEGGLRVPLILSGAGVPRGRRVDALAFVTDVAPTTLDLVGVPAEEAAPAMDGRSMLDVLRGRAERVHPPDEPVGIEVSGQAALFKGDYKLVRNNPRYGDGRWHLYDLRRDPGETRDLAASKPELFEELMADYRAYAERNGVLEMPEGFEMHEQLRRNTIRNQIRFHAAELLVTLLVLIGLIWLGLRAIVRAVRRC
ncbi:MAG: arylsulfatase [Deltaproteobacteria bacterium]|nr:MAG: arylsulfatase [Deltaproteobacteria bacterium]